MKKIYLLLLVIGWCGGTSWAEPKPLDIAPGPYLLIKHVPAKDEGIDKSNITVERVVISRDGDGKTLLGWSSVKTESGSEMRITTEIALVPAKGTFSFLKTHIQNQKTGGGDSYVGHLQENGVLEGRVTQADEAGLPQSGTFQLYPVSS